MSDLLNLVWLFLVVCLLAWALGNAVAMALSALPPAPSTRKERHRLWLLAALPWLFPLLTCLSLVALSLAKTLNWIDDHCRDHFQHHPHFCFEHLPDLALTFAQSSPVVLVASGLLVLLMTRIFAQVKQHRKGALLQRLVPALSRLNQFQDPRPLAFVMGIRQPRIFLSSGLKQWLTKRQQRLVVAHEAAHIRNHDVMKNVVFEVLLSLHLQRKILRQRWSLSTELLADQQVARRFDALELAEVLVSLERAKFSSPHPVAITGGITQTRIQHLLAPVETTEHSQLEWLTYLVLLALPTLAAFHHHALESLFGLWLK